MSFIIQQQCPFPECEETLTFTVVSHGWARGNLTVKAETTPESTKHAYSHQEEIK